MQNVTAHSSVVPVTEISPFEVRLRRGTDFFAQFYALAHSRSASERLASEQ